PGRYRAIEWDASRRAGRDVDAPRSRPAPAEVVRDRVIEVVREGAAVVDAHAEHDVLARIHVLITGASDRDAAPDGRHVRVGARLAYWGLGQAFVGQTRVDRIPRRVRLVVLAVVRNGDRVGVEVHERVRDAVIERVAQAAVRGDRLVVAAQDARSQ